MPSVPTLQNCEVKNENLDTWALWELWSARHWPVLLEIIAISMDKLKCF